MNLIPIWSIIEILKDLNVINRVYDLVLEYGHFVKIRQKESNTLLHARFETYPEIYEDGRTSSTGNIC